MSWSLGRNKMINASNIILIDRNKRILMQHRTHDAPTSPNHWGFFGGEIEKNETPLQAVKREVYEELEIKPKKPKLILKKIFNEKGKKYKSYFFIEKIKDKDKSKIRLHEGQAMKWIHPSEINKMLSKPDIKRIIKKIAKQYL